MLERSVIVALDELREAEAALNAAVEEFHNTEHENYIMPPYVQQDWMDAKSNLKMALADLMGGK